jgi:hypothetical protein
MPGTPTRRQREREIERIAALYNDDASSPRVREALDFLWGTDAAIVAARARGGDYVGPSGEYDHALYQAANRAAELRHRAEQAARELADRKRSYARRAARPTSENLAARAADLEVLRSRTRGDERAGYERDLVTCRRQLEDRRARRR